MSALLQRADKTLASAGGGLLRGFFSSEDKYETAHDLYSQAAREFRSSKEYRNAGQAYEKAAAVSEKHLDGMDTDRDTTEAVDMYKKGELWQDALRCLQVQCSRLEKNGKHDRAAKLKDEMGQIYSDLGDRKNAFRWFKDAPTELSASFSVFTKKNYLDKAAKEALLDNEFHTAIQTYEEIIVTLGKSDKLTVQDMKEEYDIKICLCYLAVLDLEGAARLPAWHRAQQPGHKSYKYTFLKGLYEAMELKDEEKFKALRTTVDTEQHILAHIDRYQFPRGASQHPSASRYPSASQMGDDEDADMY